MRQRSVLGFSVISQQATELLFSSMRERELPYRSLIRVSPSPILPPNQIFLQNFISQSSKASPMAAPLQSPSSKSCIEKSDKAKFLTLPLILIPETSVPSSPSLVFQISINLPLTVSDTAVLLIGHMATSIVFLAQMTLKIPAETTINATIAPNLIYLYFFKS